MRHVKRGGSYESTFCNFFSQKEGKMDSKTAVAAIAIGAAMLLITMVRYGLIYKRQGLSSSSARLIFTMLTISFLLLVIAGLISYYYQISINSIAVGTLIFAVTMIIICSVVIWVYFLLKGRKSQ
jgi:uncharacterized membrane protein